jgi:hypothetical protein
MTILPQERHIEIDGVPLRIENMPADLAPAASESPRPIMVANFDGAVLRVQRKSRVAGMIDVEHYMLEDADARLQPFVDAYNAERDRQAEAKRQQEEQAAAEVEESRRINAARAEQDIRDHEAQVAKEAKEAAERTNALHQPPAGKDGVVQPTVKVEPVAETKTGSS